MDSRKCIVTGSGQQSHDFVHVRDVARVLFLAAESDVAGEVFNVGSGTTCTINDLAAMMSPGRVYIPELPTRPR